MRKLKAKEKEFVKSIVLFIKLETGVIQRGRELGNKGPQKKGRWENVVREVGGCGARVVLEVHRNHIKKEKLKGKQEQIQQVVRFDDN